MYDKLVAKGNNMDAFILKTKYQTDKAELEKTISWCNWKKKQNLLS